MADISAAAAGTPASVPVRRILLGVSGSIAAYKACALASRLVQRGDIVDVMLTPEAAEFVRPLSFAAITRRRVWTSLWEAPEDISHIDLVRRADVLVLAPASAHLIARLALGLADDLVTTAALAARIPLILAPAMNSAMYEHPATRAHLETLRARGAIIVEPESGFLAEREFGIGRLAAEEHIVAAIDAVLTKARSLKGVRVLVTAGPTREPLDPVRYLSNPATGASGIALAAGAQARGALVRLILGPTHLAVPPGVEVVKVTTAEQMAAAAAAVREPAPDCIFATAAVADERPRDVHEQKRKKRDGGLSEIALEPTLDVVKTLREIFAQAYIVGFAAETEAHEANALEKLRQKALDAIIVNDVADGNAFGERHNTWTLLREGERRVFAQAAKMQLADELLDLLTPVMQTWPGRTGSA